MYHLLNSLQSYTEQLIKMHNVPALSIAVWRQNKLYKAASGILNIETGIEATTDSIFQIGSITKVFTASLVMQLVDQGKITLDRPVKHYLRDFHIADAEATQIITVRQLLNHTSGIAGDFFPSDTHSEGNAIARYVDRINLIPLVHAPGAQFSYSNAALAVAGRLVEVLTGLPWHQLMQERIFTPLGMTHAIADPKEALRYRAAMGHFPHPDNPQQWRLSSKCYSTLGLAPSGSILSMSAANLITFARTYLKQGQADSGEQWLSPDSVQQMQTPTVALPVNSDHLDRHWCLGWGQWTDKRTGTVTVYHSGLVNGQTSMLQLFPDCDMAFAILLNGARPGVLDAITHGLIKDLTDIDVSEPDPHPLKLSAAELAPYIGQFESFDAIYHIRVKEAPVEHGIQVLLEISCIDKADNTRSLSTWLPLGNHIFATFNDQGVRGRNAVFIAGPDSSSPNQLYAGLRVSYRL